MKDEEMAEEYANNIDYTKTVKMFDCVPYHENCDVADMVTQAFLAGLKAGRPQWHDLEKDPTDLPKESGRYLVYVGGGVNGVYPLDFDTEAKDFGYWCLDVGDNLGVRDTIFETVTERNEDKVIAWCEIPTFDKEQGKI